MPGLFGFVVREPAPYYKELLSSMLKVMVYENFYTYGSYVDSKFGVYIGWTCHKDSFEDCMPITNETNDIIMFFSGEVFCDPSDILQLRHKGHDFGEGNATYLVHLYEEMGDSFIKKLDGIFAGFIIDRRLNRALLFTDRFGAHRIFYSDRDGYFFSSEAKALLSALPRTREFDPKGIAELITCGATIGKHSIFKDIGILPGATTVEFQNGIVVRRSRYFEPSEWEQQSRLPKEDFFRGFVSLLRKIPSWYFSSGDNKQVGMSLTGGFDSRILMACLPAGECNIACYTFGSKYRDTYDVKVARDVAKLCGQTHQVITVGSKFLDRFKEYFEKSVFISDGYLGLSGAPELYANMIAREIAPVRVTGNWGSELLRGVRAFKFTDPIPGLLSSNVTEYVGEIRDKFYRLNKTKHHVSFVPFYQAPYQGYGRSSIERSQLTIRTPFLSNEIVRFLYRKPPSYNGFQLCKQIIEIFKPDLIRIPTDRGYLGTGSRLSKTLHRAWRQASFKLEYMASHGAPDLVVRHDTFLKCTRLDQQLLGRHKFYHLRQWSYEVFHEYIQDVLINNIPPGLTAVVDLDILKKIVREHLVKRRNHLQKIDDFLTLGTAGKTLLACPDMGAERNFSQTMF